jgi:pyrimidine-specific ribonucleoside hydrolase
MNMLIETDVGNDPDDFFTLCYLVSAGVNIKGILITPGDPEQVRLVRFFCDQVGLDIPIGVGKLDRYKRWNLGMHTELLEKYKYPDNIKHDGFGGDIAADILKKDPCDLLIIGPAKSIGAFYRDNPDFELDKATMQGGFVGYHLYAPQKRLEKFEGKTWVPTFNLNGDRKGGLRFIDAKIKRRQFVSKNICHTVLYTGDTYKRMEAPRDRASELFMEAMGIYLSKHPDKKFHDPCAAACHLHPEIATWIRGKIQKMDAGWGAVADEDGDYLVADLDYDAFWEHIYQWT